MDAASECARIRRASPATRDCSSIEPQHAPAILRREAGANVGRQCSRKPRARFVESPSTLGLEGKHWIEIRGAVDNAASRSRRDEYQMQPVVRAKPEVGDKPVRRLFSEIVASLLKPSGRDDVGGGSECPLHNE